MFNTPQTIDPAALMASVAQAKENAGSFPFIEAGQHVLALANYEQKGTQKGPCVFAYLVYLSSSNPALVGSICTKMWKLYPGTYADSLDKELGDMKSFVIAIGGTDEPAQLQASGTALLTNNGGRGCIVKCNGVPNAKGNYVATYFDHQEGQTPETIAATRGQLDNTAPMSLFSKKQEAAAAPAAAAQPAAPAPASNFLGDAAPVAAQPAAAAPAPFKIPGL